MCATLVKSNRPRLTDVAGLAAMVGDGDVIGVGGHHFARLPIALLRAVAERRPRNLRYVSWGGGLALEMLLEAEAVASIDICFSSLDIFGLPPRFRSAAESGAIAVRDWTALAMIEALRAREANLASRPFQLPAGSDMMTRIPGALTVDDPVSGSPVGVIPALGIDTFLLHASRADADGNVEIVGPRALDWPMVGAAAKVLVTVEKIVPAGHLQANGRQSILTRNRVSAIAEAPGGAWPTSCLPYYVTDYAALKTAFAGERPLAEAFRADAAPPFVHQAAAVRVNAVPKGRFPAIHNRGAPASIDEIMAVRLAAELDDESLASAGAVSPLANVAYRLAKATHAPHMVLTTMTCGHLDVRASPMVLSLIEGFDAETAVAHAGGDDTYSTYYQGGYVTHEVIGVAQVDGAARVNNIAIRKRDGGMIRLPGQGGMADVANMHRDCILYVTRHSPLSLVASVAEASSARAYVTDGERRAHGYRPGAVKLITDLCVFAFLPGERSFSVVEIMPGVTRERIVEATAFAVRFAEDCRDVALPDAETLAVLRERVDPLGLRRLEFIGSRDRGALLDEIIARDRDTVAWLVGRSA